MEKAILKTLVYADIFEYPLKAYEIHKWLIGKKASLIEVEKGLERLIKKGEVYRKEDLYFLTGRRELIKKRAEHKKISKRYLLKARVLSWFLKSILTIKLVGVSGGLAMENASKQDDIDLFIITDNNRLWISRLLASVLLDLFGTRRKVKMSNLQAKGKLCLNLLLEEGKLEQETKNLFVAHEVLQMKVLWQRDGIYSKYLSENEWVFNFLPNWITSERLKIYDLRLKSSEKNRQSSIINSKSIYDWMEYLAKRFQLKIMKPQKGQERIREGALYFHPNDYSKIVLENYRVRVKHLTSTS